MRVETLKCVILTGLWQHPCLYLSLITHGVSFAAAVRSTSFKNAVIRRQVEIKEAY